MRMFVESKLNEYFFFSSLAHLFARSLIRTAFLRRLYLLPLLFVLLSSTLTAREKKEKLFRRLRLARLRRFFYCFFGKLVCIAFPVISINKSDFIARLEYRNVNKGGEIGEKTKEYFQVLMPNANQHVRVRSSGGRLRMYLFQFVSLGALTSNCIAASAIPRRSQQIY